MNATSLTEAWDTNPASSQNHCMLGHIEEWFYSGLVGIRPAAPGFKQIIIRPQIVGDLAWARGHYDSAHGRVACAWQRSGGELSLDITVPPNTTATVYVPADQADDMRESGQPAHRMKGGKFLRMESGCAVFQVDSGRYHFSARRAPRE